MPEYEMGNPYEVAPGLIGAMLENPGQQAQLPPPSLPDTLTLQANDLDRQLGGSFEAVDRDALIRQQAMELGQNNPWARHVEATPDFLKLIGGGWDDHQNAVTDSAYEARAQSLGLPLSAQAQADQGLRAHAPVGARWEQDRTPYDTLRRERGLEAGPEEIARLAAEMANSAHLVKKDKTAELAALATAIAASAALAGPAVGAMAAPYVGATGGAIAGGAAAGATGAIGQGLYNKDLNWQDVLLGTGLGGLSGGAGAYASGAGPLARTAAGAGTAALGKTATDLARGRDIDPYGVAMAGITGGLSPGLSGLNQATTQFPPWVMQALTRLAQQGLLAAPRPRPRNPYGEG